MPALEPKQKKFPAADCLSQFMQLIDVSLSLSLSDYYKDKI